MEKEVIYIEQKIHAPIDRVWKAISDREELRHWFYDINRFWPELGCDFQFNYHRNGKKYVVLCRVKEVVEKKKLVFTWRYEGKDGSSEVIFELVPADKETIFKLTHKGAAHFEVYGKEFEINKLESTWKSSCESLKDYAEREVINKSVNIQAEPSVVWSILTSGEEIKEWVETFKKQISIESDWQEGSEVVWLNENGNTIVKGIVTVNNPEHYLKVFFPCYDTESCALNPGEDYQIYILTSISENQTLLEVECKTYTDSTGKLALAWDNALKRIKKRAEKLAKVSEPVY